MITDNIVSKVINIIIKKRINDGSITSELEKESEIAKLKEILSKDIHLVPNVQSGRTDVTKINDDLSAIEYDMYLSYEKINDILETLDSHKKLNSSMVNNMKTTMATLSDNINSLSDVVSKLDNNIVHVESFRNASSFEADPELYTLEDGTVVADGYRATFDKINECAKMPKLLVINKMIASNGQRMANIEIGKQIGGALINLKNPNNDVTKCIDTSLDTYWEETILADTPIKVQLDLDKYQGHYFGALCELNIRFNSIVEINEIELHPFGAFPLDVVSIRYYATDDVEREEDEAIQRDGDVRNLEIVGREADIKSFSFKSPKSLQFKSVPAKCLKIILNQRHYIRNAFVYNKRDTTKNQLWFGKEVECNIGISQEGVYFLKSKTDPGWMIFSDSTKPLYKNKNVSVEDFLFPNQEIIKAIKYEYSYGLYHIGVNENNYKDYGVYVSKPIVVDQNIAALRLDTVETLPDNNHTVAYYVSFTDKPKSSDWIQMHSGTTIDLLSMLKAGELSYTTTTERFFGTRGNAVTLNNIPYVNRGVASNTEINVTIIRDGVTLKEGTDIFNVTNYKSQANSFKNFDRESDKIQYYFNRDKVYFNGTQKGDIINVTYKHFINKVRFKAILKRSIDGDTSLSTMLNEYTISLKPIS